MIIVKIEKIIKINRYGRINNMKLFAEYKITHQMEIIKDKDNEESITSFLNHISAKTMNDMDRSVFNFKKGKASEAVDLSDF